MSMKLKTSTLSHAAPWFFKCFITTAILYYLFQKVPVHQIWSSLAGADILWILPAFLLQFCMYFINALQLKIFSKQQKMSFSVLDLLRINLAVQFYGLFLPGQLSGGLVKWHKLSKDNQMRAQAAACILFTRIIYMLSLAALGTGFFLLERPYDSAVILMSLVFGFLLSILLYISIANASVFSIFEAFINKIVISKIPKLFKEKINKVLVSITHFHEIRLATLNYALVLSFIFHLVGVLSIYFVMRALGINISIISVVWIRAAVTFLQLFPVSISGFGIREGAFVFLLGSYHVSSSDAMALSFIVFGVMALVALVGGMLELKEFLFQKR